MAVTDIDRRRFAAGRLASSVLAFGANDRDLADHPVNADGARAVVPAADVDRVADVADRVRRAGGAARVVALIPAEDDAVSFMFLSFDMTLLEPHVEMQNIGVGPATTVRDLFRVLGPGASMTIAICEHDALKVNDLVTEPAPEELTLA